MRCSARSLLPLCVAFAAGSGLAQTPAPQALEVYQGLEELTARIPRLADRPYEQLWDKDGFYQCERVIFRDLETSNEVWSLSQELCTDLANIERRSAWSCDGQFISFIGNKVFWNHESGKLHQRPWPGHNYVANADGSERRKLWGNVNGKLRTHAGKFNTWDQKRGNVLYYAEGGQLWRVTLGRAERDNLSEPIFTFPPAPKGVTHLIQDVGVDNVLFIEESGGRPMAEPRPAHLIDLRLAPDDPTFCRSVELKGEGHAGSYRVRRGAPLRLSGGYEAKGLGGFYLELDATRGLVPAEAPSDSAGIRMGHLAYGPPDDRVVFSGGVEGMGHGLFLRLPGQTPVKLAVVNDGHPTWCGHDPDCFFYACGTGNLAGRDPRYERRLVTGRADGSPLRVVCTPFDRRRGANEGGYDAIPRPNQSPDATKCWFHSSMLMPENKYTGSFVAVYRRPYAPTALRFVEGRLAWKPHTLSHEVRGYLLYHRRANGIWTRKGVPISGTLCDVQEPGDYFVTALEWSGLESDLSSPTLTLPGGKAGEPVTGFDREPPPAVSGFTASREPDGRIRLRWERSRSDDARYYNLYFSAEARPATTQARLILSPPAQTAEVLDWTAPQGAAGHYALVVTDRQGNVSVPSYADVPAGETR